MIHYVEAFVSTSHDRMRFQRVVLNKRDYTILIISHDFHLHKCNYMVFSRFRVLHDVLLEAVSDYASLFGQKFITHHCANIDVYRLAPEKIVILGKVSQHAAGTSGLASKEIH